MGSEETPTELGGAGYTRSGDGPAEWANTPGTTWTITARVNACGFAWLEPPVTISQEGLEVAADAITVRLS
jgi:hypothetical protein